MVYAVGKESNLKTDSLDYRYSPVEWTPGWMPLADANDALQEAVSLRDEFKPHYRFHSADRVGSGL